MNQTDHHFSKKLRDLEITPSERANELFRSRLEQISPQKEEKSPWKYFATAAAVLMALGFLFFLHLNKDVMKTDTAFVLPKPAEEIPGSEPVTEPVPAETVTPAAVNDTPPALSETRPAAVPATGQRSVIKTSHSKAKEEDLPPPAKNFLSDLQSLSPEISYRYHSTNLTDFAILDTHGPLELEVREASPRETSEKSLPLLAKVVREVKYVANGEKPDLDRAGIKPAATTFAHNQNGLLANESRQIKEGIHKFKEIFR